jgi:predicted dehydrogenase
MKIGVVGYGSIGQRHAANATKLGHEVIVYDPMLQHNDVKYEREIYEQADAVVIATPSGCHEAGLRACIERGKHVLVEKPISVSLGQLETLLKVADEKRLVVMMGNNLRFHPCVQEIKRSEISWRLWANFICSTTTDKPGYLSDGVTLCTGSHEVDLALYLLGPAQVLTATGDEKMMDFVLLHDSGARSSFHLDFVTGREVRQFWIGYERKCILVDLPARSIKTHFVDGDINTWRYPGSYDYDYEREMRDFIRQAEGAPAIYGNRAATGEDGLAALKVLLAVKKMAGI